MLGCSQALPNVQGFSAWLPWPDRNAQGIQVSAAEECLRNTRQLQCELQPSTGLETVLPVTRLTAAFFHAGKDRLELMLGLGATRMEAAKPLIQRSLATALQPSLNQMSTIGLVSIPGMMTGQILGGSSPAQACTRSLIPAIHSQCGCAAAAFTSLLCMPLLARQSESCTPWQSKHNCNCLPGSDLDTDSCSAAVAFVQAARYQMVIMFEIVATASLAVTGAVFAAVLTCVDAKHRLRSDRLHQRSGRSKGVAAWVAAQCVAVSSEPYVLLQLASLFGQAAWWRASGTQQRTGRSKGVATWVAPQCVAVSSELYALLQIANQFTTACGQEQGRGCLGGRTERCDKFLDPHALLQHSIGRQAGKAHGQERGHGCLGGPAVRCGKLLDPCALLQR